MKFREKLTMEHPENVDIKYSGGCYNCPFHYDYEPTSESMANCPQNGGNGCEYCWNREIPENKEESKMQKFKVGEFVITSWGKGEILYYDQNDGTYLVGIKGFSEGHSAQNSLPKLYDYIVDKGYQGQCLWIRDVDLALDTEKDTSNQVMIDHPAHYNTGKREVIKEMRLMFGDEAVAAFCKLNVYKYMRRAEYKGHKEEDLKKAEWYMDYLEKMGGEVNG